MKAPKKLLCSAVGSLFGLLSLAESASAYNTMAAFTPAGASNGVIMTGSPFDSTFDGELTNDNKIVVGGRYYTPSGTPIAAVARFLANGSPDLSFGFGGIAPVSCPASTDVPFIVENLSVDTSNRIAIFMEMKNGGRSCLSRLHANGVIDSSFGSNGAVLPFSIGGTSLWVKVDRNGGDKIVVGQYSGTGTTDVARYNYSGNTREFRVNHTASFSYPEDLHVDASSRILAVGYKRFGTEAHIQVARLRADNGNLDQTFGSGGTNTLDFGFGNQRGIDVAVDSLGRVVVLGIPDTPPANGLATALVAQLSSSGAHIGAFVASFASRARSGGPNWALTTQGQDFFIAGPGSRNNQSQLILAKYAGSTLNQLWANEIPIVGGINVMSVDANNAGESIVFGY
jgi:uncharacterized delta-60 repeat protein